MLRSGCLGMKDMFYVGNTLSIDVFIRTNSEHRRQLLQVYCFPVKTKGYTWVCVCLCVHSINRGLLKLMKSLSGIVIQ